MKLVKTILAVSAILAITACTQKEDTTSIKEEVKTETTVVETKETSQEATVVAPEKPVNASQTAPSTEVPPETQEGVVVAPEGFEEPVEQSAEPADNTTSKK